MFQIYSTPIDTAGFKKTLLTDNAGAYVVFEGLVRNHNDGKNVLSLEYEVFASLSIKEADRIISEAKSKFDIINAYIIHREGHLQIGDIAVFIGVTAEHRDDAFKACRYLIDEIKFRLPIWKKEHYADGNAHWVNCHGCQKVHADHPGHHIS